MVSDVIANAKAGNLLVTVQIHNNVIAAANLVDICGIVVTQGKLPGRRRREDGGEGGDPDLHDRPEPLAGRDQALRGRGPLTSARCTVREACAADHRLLDCEVVWGHELLDGCEVEACFAADLMSDVLAFSEPGRPAHHRAGQHPVGPHRRRGRSGGDPLRGGQAAGSAGRSNSPGRGTIPLLTTRLLACSTSARSCATRALKAGSDSDRARSGNAWTEVLYTERFTILGNDFEHGGDVAAADQGDPEAVRAPDRT